MQSSLRIAAYEFDHNFNHLIGNQMNEIHKGHGNGRQYRINI